MEKPKQIRPEWVPEAYKETVKPGKLKSEKTGQLTDTVANKSTQTKAKK